MKLICENSMSTDGPRRSVCKHAQTGQWNLAQGLWLCISLVVRRVAKYPPGTLGEAYPMTGQLREHIWGHPWARSPPLETIRETCCDGDILFLALHVLEQFLFLFTP